MSDQQATPETGEATAAADTPGNGAGTQQEVPWQKRYEDLRPQFDRTTQELAELRQQAQQYTDPEYQAQVAQEWLAQQGYQLPEDESQQFDDPTEVLAARLEALEGQLTERQQAEQHAQQVEALEQSTEQKLAQFDGLDDDDKAWVVSRAISLPPSDDGGLDVKTAYDQLVARDLAQQRKWVKTKRAPYVPSGGRDATEAPVLGPDATHEQRVAFAAQQYQDMTGSE